eukprot:1704350-Pleurochrysis_carterae.AAC.2
MRSETAVIYVQIFYFSVHQARWVGGCMAFACRMVTRRHLALADVRMITTAAAAQGGCCFNPNYPPPCWHTVEGLRFASRGL